MKIDSKSVLGDFLARAIRGELSEREQRNVLEVCAQIADASHIDKLIALAGSDSAAATARTRALEVIAQRDPAKGVEIARTFLDRPESSMQRLALRVADNDWFRNEPALVNALCELTMRQDNSELRQEAQAALTLLEFSDARSARALLRVWLDEPDAGLRSIFANRLAERSAAGRHLLREAATRLTEAVAVGAGSWRDWVLLGRLRCKGVEVPTGMVPFVPRLLSSMHTKFKSRDVVRPSILRSVAYAALAVLLLFGVLWPLGMNQVRADEAAMYAFWACVLAGVLGWLFGRVAVPVALVPDRWALFPAETLSAAALAFVIALASALLINLDDTIDLPDRLLLFVVPLVAAFASVRFVSLAAYGLSDAASSRWRLQSVAAATTGCSVLVLVCLFDPSGDSGHEMVVLLFSAPVLITMSMVYASIDNELADQRAREGPMRRWTVLAPVAVVALLVVAFSFRETALTQTSLRGLTVDRMADAGPTTYRVPLGEAFEIRSPLRQEIVFTASYGGADIWLNVGQDEVTVTGDDPDSATMELVRGVVTVCVDFYPRKCGRDDEAGDGPGEEPNFIEFANELAHSLRTRLDPLRSGVLESRVARLTLEGGITRQQAEQLADFDKWLQGLPERPISKETGTPPDLPPGYMVAAQDIELQWSTTTDGGVEVQRRMDSTAVAGDRNTMASRDVVRLAAGSIVYRHKSGPLFLVQGRTQPLTGRVRSTKRLPELRALEGRPDDSVLERARVGMDLRAKPGFESAVNEGLLSLLQRGEERALDVVEPLLGGAEQQYRAGSMVLSMERYRTLGAGVFRLQRSESPETLKARLMYGWNRLGTSADDCYRLRTEEVVALGNTWDESWQQPIDALRDGGVEVTGAKQFGPVALPGNTAECTRTADRAASVDDLTARQGEFLRRHRISQDQPTAPSIFTHYFVVVEELGYHESALPRGTIVSGLEWDGSGGANFNIVYGFGACGGLTCWADLAGMTYLGPEYESAYDDIPGRFKQVWTIDEKARFGDRNLIDQRPPR